MKILRTLINHETGKVDTVVQFEYDHPVYGKISSDATIQLDEAVDLAGPEWGSNQPLVDAVKAKAKVAAVSVAEPIAAAVETPVVDA